MAKHSAENEQIKRKYRIWLQDAKGRSIASIDQALAAINDFENFTKFKPFRLFHVEQARAYVRDLHKRVNPNTGKPYSRSTLNGMLGALRKFIEWLGGQQGFSRRISYGDANYFRLAENEERIARATRPKRVPEVDEVRRVIAAMPANSDTEKRDRAIVAFLLSTAARIDAVASTCLKQVNLAEGVFDQDPREVRTKNGKHITTWFFPVGDEVRGIVKDWITFLREEKGYSPDDPLFPSTDVRPDSDGRFAAIGLGRKHGANGNAIRDIFKNAFIAVGLPAPHPHVMRDTLTRLGQRKCATPEEFKAWSQNVGHEKVMTTLTSYGRVEPERQAAIIRGIGNRCDVADLNGAPTPELVGWVMEHIKRDYGSRSGA